MPSNAELIDGLVDKLSGLFSNSESLKAGAQNNLRAVVQSAVSKLDIVSREEFDAQVAVLHRSREKIEALEAQLNALSQQLDDPAKDKE